MRVDRSCVLCVCVCVCERERKRMHFIILLIGYCCCLVVKSCATLFATPWAIACQASLPMGFPRQEYCSGLPFPSQGIFLMDPGIETESPALSGGFFTTEPPGKPSCWQDTESKALNSSGRALGGVWNKLVFKKDKRSFPVWTGLWPS